MSERLVYLDHNATTPIHPVVQQTMMDAMACYGNPSSLHQFGRVAREKLEAARAACAAFIHAEPDEVIFVGSGSEANNTVLNQFSCSCSCSRSELCSNQRQEIVTTQIEHPCILETAKCLGIRDLKVHFVPVDKAGRVTLETLSSFVSDKTALVSVMMANNEIGTIQDVRAMAALAHERGAYFHTDAVQAVGKIPVDVQALDVDFLSFSAHKIYGPKGIGALYVRKGIPFCPFIRGGHQELGRRAGTENTLGIIGFGAAIEQRALEMQDEHLRLLGLKNKLRDGLASLPDVHFNGDPENCIAGTLNASFYGAEGESLLLYLDLVGIAVSTGSACSSGSLDPSHVLLATGATPELAHGSLRFSLGRDTMEADIDYTIEKVIWAVNKVRSMSTIPMTAM